MKKIITLVTLIFAFGQMSFGQNNCKPTFYILEKGETMPVISSKDTTLTVKYSFPSDCKNQEIVIDSTKTSPLGVICIKNVSVGNKFTPYVLSCLRAGQNTTKEAHIIVYYHYKNTSYTKMAGFSVKL